MSKTPVTDAAVKEHCGTHFHHALAEVCRGLEEENNRLRLALMDIATTRTQHLRSSQMQVAMHGMKAKARLALQSLPATDLEKGLPWL